MVLLRLSPLIPFNALDYISGITSISLRDYTIALIAILPGAIVLCIAGASAESLSDRTASTGNGVVETIVIVVGLVLGCYGVYLASHYSKVELDRVSYYCLWFERDFYARIGYFFIGSTRDGNVGTGFRECGSIISLNNEVIFFSLSFFFFTAWIVSCHLAPIVSKDSGCSIRTKFDGSRF